MADRSVKIIIETIAQGRGAEVTRQEWEKVTSATHNANEELRKYAENMRKVEEARAAARQGAPGSAAGADPATLDRLRREQIALNRQTPEQQRLRAQEMAYARMRERQGDPPVIQPPPIPEQDEEGGGRGGAFGRAAFRRFLGPAALVTAALSAYRAAVNVTKEWLSNIDALFAKHREFETAGQHVATVANLTREAARETERLAQRYAHIEKQVYSTVAAVNHWSQSVERQISLEQRLDDATTNRMRAEAEFQHRFDPIGRIRALEDIEEQHFQRQMDREKRAEQARIDALHLQERLAKSREDTDRHTMQRVNDAIPAAEREARVAERQAAAQEKTGEQLREQIDAERKYVQEMALGKTGLTTRQAYNIQRLKNMDIIPASQASTSLGLGIDMEANANTRLTELDDMLKGIAQGDDRARTLAEQKRFRADQLKAEREFLQQRVMQSGSDAATAAREAGERSRLMQQSEEARPRILDETIRGMQQREQLDILNQTPGASVPPGGGASADMQKLIEAVERVAFNTSNLDRKWEAAA